MSGITKQDGPVAVTGASGYIGSRIVEDLLDQGYDVHACVRDASNSNKVDHLIKLDKDNEKNIQNEQCIQYYPILREALLSGDLSFSYLCCGLWYIAAFKTLFYYDW